MAYNNGWCETDMTNYYGGVGFWDLEKSAPRAQVNQHPPAHHPVDAHYYSVVDEPQTELIFGFTLLTNSVRNRSHI
jgi:hypothetical protein